MATSAITPFAERRFYQPGDPVRIYWQVKADPGDSQSAFELETSAGPDFGQVLDRHHSEGQEQTALAPGGPLAPREIRYVRVRTEIDGRWSDWSEPVVVEGTLSGAEWTASAIGLPDDPGSREQSPAPLLRRSFTIDGDVEQARIYVTSLGVNRAVINGRPVSDELLNPGWTSYHNRLLAAAYDVTDLLVAGENVIAATLGDGWYRGRLGWDPEDARGRYGRELSLIAQLEIVQTNGSIVRIHTDGSWKASTGAIRKADLYDGCWIDLRDEPLGWDRPGFDDSEWTPVRTAAPDLSAVQQRTAPPVRVIGSWPVDLQRGGDGVLRLDGGQNISGFLRLKVKGNRGDQVVVKHAEVLNPDGSLHTFALRSAKATDTYVLADSEEVQLEPEFTFHGFRYAEVATSAEVLSAEFVAISSDLARRATFESSHAGLNRLHENALWSLRDNFVAIPTDCPQRDERLGWTGDAQAFASTACTLVDSLSFWRSWLEDLALDQHPELGPPAVVPDVVLEGPMRYGRAGWADAATIVPWAVYLSYGDVDVLEQQFASMTTWVDSLQQRLEPDGLLPESPQFGDWLDPDAPGDKPWQAKVDPTFIANAFFSHSARVLSDAARVLGRSPELVDHYAQMSSDLGRATWERWSNHIEDSQSGCAIALGLDVVPHDERHRVGEALARLVREAGGRISTGFLGTPFVLPALASEGFLAEAYSMLLCREMPSWLYQVDQGATTTWERWDAIRPDGSIHPGIMSPPPGTDGEGGHMLSFNHYAYGAVVDWVYRNVAGIAPDPSDPGYRSVLLRPRPSREIEWARSSIATRYGTIVVDWSVEGRTFEARVVLPFGTKGVFDGPVSPDSDLLVDGDPATGPVRLAAGTHTIRISNVRMAEDGPHDG